LKKQGTIKSYISNESQGLASAALNTVRASEEDKESSNEEAEGDLKVRKR
jgi:hypothetical protein